MLLLHDQQTAIVTPGKRASTTLVHALGAIGAELIEHDGYHVYGWEPSAAKVFWRVLLVIRNPFDLAVSLYKWAVVRHGETAPFDEWSAALPRPRPSSHYWLRPNAWYCDRCYESWARWPDGYLRVEQLAADCRLWLKWRGRMPRLNTLPDATDYYDRWPDAVNNVRQWAARDFKLGYSETPCAKSSC